MPNLSAKKNSNHSICKLWTKLVLCKTAFRGNNSHKQILKQIPVSNSIKVVGRKLDKTVQVPNKWQSCELHTKSCDKNPVLPNRDKDANITNSLNWIQYYPTRTKVTNFTQNPITKIQYYSTGKKLQHRLQNKKNQLPTKRIPKNLVCWYSGRIPVKQKIVVKKSLEYSKYFTEVLIISEWERGKERKTEQKKRVFCFLYIDHNLLIQCNEILFGRGSELHNFITKTSFS